MPKNNRPGPRPAQSAQAAKQFAPVAAALVCGLAATFILLLIFSWMFTKTQIPAWWAVPLATAAVCVGCFVSAHVLAKKIKKNGLFCGLCAGAFFFVIYLAAALLNGQFEFTTLASIKLVCYLLAGCFGGYLGILAAEKQLRTHHAK